MIGDVMYVQPRTKRRIRRIAQQRLQQLRNRNRLVRELEARGLKPGTKIARTSGYIMEVPER